MRLSARDWNRYITKLSLVNEAAAKKMQAFIDANGMEDMDAVVDYAYGLATAYGEAAGELACEMYDAIVEASGKSFPPAEMAPTATYTETSIAVRGTVKNKYNTVPQTVGRLVKQAGADTTLQNAKRDGAQFAWVPHGGETCAFCITLASRGWQYISKRAMRNGHAEHIHANCNCEYAISFDKNPHLEGYDPDKYLDMYKNAEGATPAEKIKNIRRMLEEKREVVEEAFTPQTRLLQALKDGTQIAYNPVQTYDKTPSEMAIIEKLGGGDKTNGSCSSVAFAYVGNKNGLDVTDFRGGGSQMIFSRSGNIEQIIKMVGGETATDNSDFKSANALLRLMEEGKEYYLGTGKHAAIVRLKDGHYEYLELQSATKNGWHPLDDSVLKNRFGCAKTHKLGRDKFQVPSYMAEVGSFKDNKEFRELLGYINTQTDKQQKGAGGYAK